MEPNFTQIIEKYLENKATDSEKQALLGWLRISDNNLSEFERIAKGWENKINRFSDIDKLDKQLIVIYDRIKVRKRFIKLYYALGSAAAAITILLAVLFIMPKEKNVEYISVVTNDLKQRIILPDSSVVWLNRNSTLEYPQKFSEMREVHLRGEGYFDVREDPQHPFIVTSDNLQIEVMGTKFLVTDVEGEEDSEVVLEEGSVKLGANGFDESYILHPDQMAKYNRIKGKCVIDNVNASDYTNWKSERLVFSNIPLKSVFVQIEKWFGVTIICDNNRILSIPVTITIDDEGLFEVLEMLSDVAHYQYNIEERKILVDI